MRRSRAGGSLYAKVRAVTRVASPANEQQILEVALAATGAQLERICRGFRRATEIETEAAADRRVRARVLGDGLVKLEVVVSADEAELVLKAIEHVREQLAPKVSPDGGQSGGLDRAAGLSPRPTAADALVHMASASLAGSGVKTDSAAPERYQVVVHVDRELTSPDLALAATLEDGTHISAETLRRVACDGGVVAAVVDERGAVLDVGRRTRAISVAIRRCRLGERVVGGRPR